MSAHSSLAIVLLSASIAWAQPVYPDAEAARHVGEDATVTGKVFSISTSGKGNTFINLGDRFPRHTFGAVVFSRDTDAVGDVKQFDGKEVAITGRIELSPTDQKPQIVVKSAGQLKLASPAPAPAPPVPAPAVVSTPSTSSPSSAPPMAKPSAPAQAPAQAPAPKPETPIVEPVASKTAGTIGLANGWSSNRRGGDMVRMDLARLLGDVGKASDMTTVDTSVEVYPGVKFLTPLNLAKKFLNLDGASAKTTKVTTPGFPADSLSATSFSGVFAGGFSRLYFVTDSQDQIISALVVDSGSRTRVPNETDTDGYHVYNFVTGGAKATGSLAIRHEVKRSKETPGLITVDTLLLDPTDPDTPPAMRTKSSSRTKPKTAKVLERSRWYIPAPVVNLILRCVTG